MSEIEKIKRYIALTGIKVHGQDRYAMNMREVRELMRSGEERPFNAIDLAFEYGRAPKATGRRKRRRGDERNLRDCG